MLRKKLWVFMGLMMLLAGCGETATSKGGNFPSDAPRASAQGGVKADANVAATAPASEPGFSGGGAAASDRAPPPAPQPAPSQADSAPAQSFKKAAPRLLDHSDASSA